MFLRIALSCMLVCAIAAVEAGSLAAGKTGRTPVLIDGKTSQKRPIKLKIQRRTVDIRRFVIELRCSDGGVLILYESGFLPSPVGRGGRVQDYQFGRTDKVWIRGQLRGRSFRGRLRVKDTLGKGGNRVRCDSRWVKFHAS